MDDSYRQLLAAATIRDRTVSRIGIQPAVELGRVPVFSVTHIRETEIVLFSPEKGHGVKPFSPTKHVARRRLPLALSYHPMFDADAFAGEPIRPARDIAGREDS
jgi:hypothetical protein